MANKAQSPAYDAFALGADSPVGNYSDRIQPYQAGPGGGPTPAGAGQANIPGVGSVTLPEGTSIGSSASTGPVAQSLGGFMDVGPDLSQIGAGFGGSASSNRPISQEASASASATKDTMSKLLLIGGLLIAGIVGWRMTKGGK